MVHFRDKARVLGLAVVAGLVLAACGGKATPSSGGGGGGTSSGNTAKLKAAQISGIGAVLQAPSGLTLYHLTTDVNGKITCTGSCVSNWPPLIAASGKVPPASPDLAGHLGTVKRPDGTLQVTFDGMPVYTYSGDSGPGQTNGQGVGGVWFAVTTSGVSSSSSGPPGY
jgi:predicted lipoprotein with Yx(FWY)xxD motif